MSSDPSRPSLSCRTSPPQGGRLGGRNAGDLPSPLWGGWRAKRAGWGWRRNAPSFMHPAASPPPPGPPGHPPHKGEGIAAAFAILLLPIPALASDLPQNFVRLVDIDPTIRQD